MLTLARYHGKHSVTKKDFSIDVGYERFLAPEIFFHPEFAHPAYTDSISTQVYNCIDGCPIDVKRGLYKNIVLSGGSTMFKDFGKRLKRDVQRFADNQIKATVAKNVNSDIVPKPIEVKVGLN